MFDLFNVICSQPLATARRCRTESDLIPLIKASLLLLIVGTSSFGLVLGGARDLSQALATAVKLPLVWIVTLALCAPAFYAIAAVFGQPWRLRALLALTLTFWCIHQPRKVGAMLPVLWLFSDVFQSSSRFYHQLTLLASLIYATSGLAALGVLLRGFDRKLATAPLLGLFAVVFFLVAGQTAWSLRPFVGRPSQAEVPWFRNPEGTFFEAIGRDLDSARGRYVHESQREEW